SVQAVKCDLSPVSSGKCPSDRDSRSEPVYAGGHIQSVQTVVYRAVLIRFGHHIHRPCSWVNHRSGNYSCLRVASYVRAGKICSGCSRNSGGGICEIYLPKRRRVAVRIEGIDTVVECRNIDYVMRAGTWNCDIRQVEWLPDDVSVHRLALYL